MIEHIVLMRWKDDAKVDAIERVLTELRTLKTKVPAIVDLTCGENFSDRNKGYTHALVVRFHDRAGLQTYGPHPEHQRVMQNFIKPIAADVLAVDYEF